LTVRVVVDVLGNTLVNRIVLDGNVNCDTRLKVDDVLSKCFNLRLILLKLVEKIKRSPLGVVEFFLKLQDVCRGSGQLVLELDLGKTHLFLVVSCHL
jgi:hypothetical protein